MALKCSVSCAECAEPVPDWGSAVYLYKPCCGIGPLLNLLYTPVVPGSTASSAEKPLKSAPQAKHPLNFFLERKKNLLLICCNLCLLCDSAAEPVSETVLIIRKLVPVHTQTSYNYHSLTKAIFYKSLVLFFQHG